MYSKIYVPVDNSDFSNRAIANAVALGKAFDSALVGSHVYAARMHDYRFKQMEYTLPEEYLDEVELERQRKIHDSLITLGLKLISESYLDQMQGLCRDEGLAFEPRMMDGKHHTELVRDIQGVGSALVDAEGRTLYFADQENNGAIRCVNDCVTFWLPLTVPSGATPTAGTGVGGALATVARPDGQLVSRGDPVPRNS